MILPTKGIAPERALLTVAAQISMVLTEPMTVSQVWNGIKIWRTKNRNGALIPFSWFVLALDVLYSLDAIHFDGERLHKKARN